MIILIFIVSFILDASEVYGSFLKQWKSNDYCDSEYIIT